MTRKLEELFNLPEPDQEQIQQAEQDIEESRQALENANTIIDRIDQALPQVADLDSADNELDELSNLAKDKFEDLMNLGMNVEARYSGTILQTAGILLGHAITAKQAKIDKKLRMVDLQLKKMRLDQNSQKDASNGTSAIPGQATVIDRNELLNRILNAGKDEKSGK